MNGKRHPDSGCKARLPNGTKKYRSNDGGKISGICDRISVGNPSEFYLRKHAQKFCSKHPEYSFKQLCRLAAELFGRRDKGNADTQAKTAVKVVILRGARK